MGRYLDSSARSSDHDLSLYVKTWQRSRRYYGIRPRGVIGRSDRRWIFIVGCPRSGTTCTAKALGRVRGLTDLGEVNVLKRRVPTIHDTARSPVHRPEAILQLRRILSLSQRAGMASHTRPIEQTPEAAFIIAELAVAFPDSTFVHVIRDGRDVVASLLNRGWLADSGNAVDGSTQDDAGLRFGSYPRFWVEPERAAEFATSTEAKRCAWAWRRYVTAARDALCTLPEDRSITVRYEDMADSPVITAERLASGLDMSSESEQFRASFETIHSRSVGAHLDQLSECQVREIDEEAGGILKELGYADRVST